MTDLKSKTIGWIGTGIMGNSMCLNLLKSGFSLNVYNRTKEKTENLVKEGATYAETVAQLSANSDIIFTILGYPKDVESVYLDDSGIIKNAKEGTILVDMTTSQPSLAKKIAEAGREKNIQVLDAPVSGGDIGASEGSLAIMLGGEKAAYEIVLPILEKLGKNINYFGEAGSGQHTKMANQIVIASTMIGVVEALRYSEIANLDLNKVVNMIGSGAASCWSLTNMAPRIIDNNFKPGFMIKHFLKDLNIAIQEAENMKLNLPGLALARKFYLNASEAGIGDEGTQALYKMY